MSFANLWRRALPVCAAALSLGFAWGMPLGEAPDELAHIRYAESLAEGRLPDTKLPLDEGYEAHQPPLGYVLPALVFAARGGLDLRPEQDPEFDFHRRGSRAFRVPFARERDALTLRLARSTQAFWVALGIWASLAMAASARGAAPFLLAPQLLFVSGVIGNDAPLVAISSCALLALVRFVENGGSAILPAALLTLALFTKASGLFLLAPVAVALARPGDVHGAASALRRRLQLASASLAGLALWFALELARSGRLFPRIPTAHRLASLSEILFDPNWLGGLFRSFWAKFGWMNTPLPAPFYLWFAALSATALYALVRGRDPRHRLFQAAVAGNFALLLTYQLLVDRQAQGRYLLPSIAAVACAGSGVIPERLRAPLAWLALLIAIFSIASVSNAYA